MVSKLIPDPDVRVCSVWLVGGVCLFGPVIPWDITRTLCLHKGGGGGGGGGGGAWASLKLVDSF